MEIQPLGIEGAWAVTPRQHHDARGVFLEGYRGDRLAEVVGHRPDVVQTNISVSSRGTLRGVHFADVPPSQAKYVTALGGALLDLVVDVRVGSPTFGRVEAVRLDIEDRRAVYLSEGLGHALFALEDGSTALYLCTATHPSASTAYSRWTPRWPCRCPTGSSRCCRPRMPGRRRWRRPVSAGCCRSMPCAWPTGDGWRRMPRGQSWGSRRRAPEPVPASQSWVL
jgi:dTDP-4-dehydrorhamnose 3,5-epimerase